MTHPSDRLAERLIDQAEASKVEGDYAIADLLLEAAASLAKQQATGSVAVVRHERGRAYALLDESYDLAKAPPDGARLYLHAGVEQQATPEAPENGPWCLWCHKAGHTSTECHSTHGVNTAPAKELLRLCRAAPPSQVPAAQSGGGVYEAMRSLTTLHSYLEESLEADNEGAGNAPDDWRDDIEYSRNAVLTIKTILATPSPQEPTVAQGAPMAAGETVAWLIEHSNQAPGGGIAWVCSTTREGGSEHLQWTTDSNEAIKFESKRAAELMAQAFRWPNDCIRATEHKWIGGSHG